MCWFVTLGASPAGAAALDDLGRARGGLNVRKSSNPDVARIFGDADVTVDVTYGGCSCAFYTAVPETRPDHVERARSRYRRKGWSEAKIARALEASETAKSAAIGRNRDIGPEAAFRDAVGRQVREFGSVRVFAHLYNGAQDEEKVVSAGRQRITLNAFLESGFPPDQLVEIVEGG
jgi:hypothetical protein